MNIACALRWGVAFVGITLLGVAHPNWGKYFRCGLYSGGLLSSRAARVKKSDMWLLLFIFVKFLDQTSYGMYFYVK